MDRERMLRISRVLHFMAMREQDFAPFVLLKDTMPTIEEINNFSLMLREYAAHKKMGLWEALLHYCETTKMESEVAASLLNKSVRMDITDEVQDLNLLRRRGKKAKKLPI